MRRGHVVPSVSQPKWTKKRSRAAQRGASAARAFRTFPPKEELTKLTKRFKELHSGFNFNEFHGWMSGQVSRMKHPLTSKPYSAYSQDEYKEMYRNVVRDTPGHPDAYKLRKVSEEAMLSFKQFLAEMDAASVQMAELSAREAAVNARKLNKNRPEDAELTNIGRAKKQLLPKLKAEEDAKAKEDAAKGKASTVSTPGSSGAATPGQG